MAFQMKPLCATASKYSSCRWSIDHMTVCWTLQQLARTRAHESQQQQYGTFKCWAFYRENMSK